MYALFEEFASNYGSPTDLYTPPDCSSAGGELVVGNWTELQNGHSEYDFINFGLHFAPAADAAAAAVPHVYFRTPYGDGSGAVLTTSPALSANDVRLRDFALELGYIAGPMQMSAHFSDGTVTSFDRNVASGSAGITSLLIRVTVPPSGKHVVEFRAASDTTVVSLSTSSVSSLASNSAFNNTGAMYARIELTNGVAHFFINGVEVGQASVGARTSRGAFLAVMQNNAGVSAPAPAVVKLIKVEQINLDSRLLLIDEFDGSGSLNGRTPATALFGANWSYVSATGQNAALTGDGAVLVNSNAALTTFASTQPALRIGLTPGSN